MLALSYKSTKTRFVFFRRGKKDGSSPEIRLRRFASKAKIYNRLDMFFSISFLVLLLILALSNVQTWFFVGLTLNFDRIGSRTIRTWKSIQESLPILSPDLIYIGGAAGEPLKIKGRAF